MRLLLPLICLALAGCPAPLVKITSAVSLTPENQSYVIECVRDIAAGVGRRRHFAVAPVVAREEATIEREPPSV